MVAINKGFSREPMFGCSVVINMVVDINKPAGLICGSLYSTKGVQSKQDGPYTSSTVLITTGHFSNTLVTNELSVSVLLVPFQLMGSCVLAIIMPLCG